ncbi:transporter substrate-binding domain-containing protein, partial [bacterium]|nr:transporter substrate-binding domain-containing protein [bacterium]
MARNILRLVFSERMMYLLEYSCGHWSTSKEITYNKKGSWLDEFLVFSARIDGGNHIHAVSFACALPMKNTGLHKWVAIIFQALLLAALFTGLVGWHIPVSAQTTPPVEPTPTVVSSASQKPVIRVGGSATNPPYEFLENGQPAGFSIDVINAVGREMGFDVEFALSTTQQARQYLLDGKLDMLTGLAYSTNRDATFDFSVPITYTSFDLYVRNDSLARSLEDVRGKEIVVISGSVVQDYLESERFTSRIVQVNDATEAIQLLSQNDYAGTILSRIQAEYLMRSMNVTNLHRVGVDIMTRKFAFGVAEGNRELLAKLNEGLYILSTSGSLQDLQEHWFGVYEERDAWIQMRPYILGLGVALLFLFATLLWIWTLRRRVNVHTRELRRSQNQYRLLVDYATEGGIV